VNDPKLSLTQYDADVLIASEVTICGPRDFATASLQFGDTNSPSKALPRINRLRVDRRLGPDEVSSPPEDALQRVGDVADREGDGPHQRPCPKMAPIEQQDTGSVLSAANQGAPRAANC
jgi:hypothetical protein